jgi:hypothetical protein
MLSQSEFAAIADEVASNIYNVVDHSISGYRIVLTVRSGSRKLRYPVTIEYDPVEDSFAHNDPYPGGGAKIIFRREFRERQRAL